MGDEILSAETQMLLALSTGLQPVIEGAAGIKASVMDQGFTEETAEAVAREFLISVMRRSL